MSHLERFVTLRNVKLRKVCHTLKGFSHLKRFVTLRDVCDLSQLEMSNLERSVILTEVCHTLKDTYVTLGKVCHN